MNHLYDIKSEQETFTILRAQNKKIQDLITELECKEEVIRNLKSNLTKISEYENHIFNYKKQISKLNEKIIYLETSMTEHHNKSNLNLKFIQDLEIDLKSKDKIICDQMETLKQYEAQINKSKKEINEKLNLINKNKNENEDLKSSIKNFVLKINLYEEDIKSLQKEKSDLDKNINNQKFQFDDKAEQLVDLIKSQNGELNLLSNKLSKLENENSYMNNINKKYKLEIEEMIINFETLKENLNNFKKFEVRVKECENLISDMINIIENEKKKNSEFDKENEGLKLKIEELISKCVILDDMKEKLKIKEDENSNLNKQIESLREFLRNKDNNFKEIENEVNNYVSYINSSMMTCLKWADTYLGVYMNNTNKTSTGNNFYENSNSFKTSISNFNFNYKFITDKVNLDSFSQILSNIQKRINKELNEYEITLLELKNENSNLLQKVQNLLNDNSELKEEKLKLTDDNLVRNELFHKNKKESELYKERLEIVERKKNENENTYAQFLINLHNDLVSNFENLKQIQEISNKNNFLFPENLIINNNLNCSSQINNLNHIRDQVRDYFDNFIEIIKFLSNEYVISTSKLEDLQKIKIDCEELKKQFDEYKKNCQNEIEKMRKENNEKLKLSEENKFSELKKLDELYKGKLEKLKNTVQDKEELIDNINNNNEMLKNQLKIVELNFENFKISRKDYKKSEDLQEIKKKLEKEIYKMKSELEMKKV